jgi:hypothetical protein
MKKVILRENFVRKLLRPKRSFIKSVPGLAVVLEQPRSRPVGDAHLERRRVVRVELVQTRRKPTAQITDADLAHQLPSG